MNHLEKKWKKLDDGKGADDAKAAGETLDRDEVIEVSPLITALRYIECYNCVIRYRWRLRRCQLSTPLIISLERSKLGSYRLGNMKMRRPGGSGGSWTRRRSRNIYWRTPRRTEELVVTFRIDVILRRMIDLVPFTELFVLCRLKMQDAKVQINTEFSLRIASKNVMTRRRSTQGTKNQCLR